MPTAIAVAIDEADVIAPRIPKKLRRPPPLFIHDKGRWASKFNRRPSRTFAIYPPFSRHLKFAYYIYSIKEEREFRVVLREVPKELPIEEVKEDLLV
ncbi:hypothetical protein EVAR_11794_1 [Eumeta japonica]|uniref:Uncharacterized protein n=1 Tax=Eumeta variegata TaxID=151549 RepID=A0A4C1UQS5_EUMVA|nr:hypothetical protein EVAR_11794_1 [Eumeta japonica]